MLNAPKPEGLCGQTRKCVAFGEEFSESEIPSFARIFGDNTKLVRKPETPDQRHAGANPSL